MSPSSTMAQSSPARASPYAMAEPTSPPPITIASNRLIRRHSHHALLSSECHCRYIEATGGSAICGAASADPDAAGLRLHKEIAKMRCTAAPLALPITSRVGDTVADRHGRGDDNDITAEPSAPDRQLGRSDADTGGRLCRSENLPLGQCRRRQFDGPLRPAGNLPAADGYELLRAADPARPRDETGAGSRGGLEADRPDHLALQIAPGRQVPRRHRF